MPTCPVGYVIYEAITRLNLSYGEAVRLINKVAQASGEKGVNYSRTALNRWLTGTIPLPQAQRLIVRALDIPKATFAKAVKAQEEARLLAAAPCNDELVQATRAPATASAREPVDVLRRSSPMPYAFAEDPFTMLRRQFLERLLAAGSALIAPSHLRVAVASGLTDTRDVDVLLHECEATLATSWRLINGNHITVVPSLLLSCLPILDTMLREPSEHRGQLAALAAHGYILAGLVTVLQGQYAYAEWCCRQSVEYAKDTSDANLIVGSLKHLAVKYHSANYPLLTLRTYEDALPLLGGASPLLQSRTYLGLALSHAECGNEYQAIRYLSLAQEGFPDDAPNDPAFAYADCRRSSLNHYGGLIHLACGRPREAWTALAGGIEASLEAVPERTVVELINCQAEAALTGGDLELAVSHLEAGIAGARRLQSRKRFRDSLHIYRQLSAAWPNEPRVRCLRGLLQSSDAGTWLSAEEYEHQ